MTQTKAFPDHLSLFTFTCQNVIACKLPYCSFHYDDSICWLAPSNLYF